MEWALLGYVDSPKCLFCASTVSLLKSRGIAKDHWRIYGGKASFQLISQVSQVVAPKGAIHISTGCEPCVYKVVIIFKSCKDGTFIFAIYAI